MNKVQQGFTLIELMIVVAIMGILASIAIPKYQDRVARAEAAAALASIAPLKSGVEYYVLTGQSNSITLANVGQTRATANPLGTMAVAFTNNGTGTLTFTLNGKTSPKTMNSVVTLTRNAEGSWSCATDLASKYKPRGCA